MRNCVVCMMTLLIWASVGKASGEDADLANVFRDKNISGTIVLTSHDGRTTYMHNGNRARTPFLPASTFKIPNTLIALEENAIKDEKEIIAWDGKDRGVLAWNKDQSLETAFPSSCVWFYQELAKRVGMNKYASYLQTMRYGNHRPGPEVTTFWLNGDLRISAMEQIAFLKGVGGRTYPFKKTSYEILRKLMIVVEAPAYIVRAKTGWAQEQHVGWFVGYVESRCRLWLFATNLEIIHPEDNRLRQEITLEVLKVKGII